MNISFLNSHEPIVTLVTSLVFIQLVSLIVAPVALWLLTRIAMARG